MNIKEELEEVRHNNNGILIPEKVVEYAEDTNSALHNRFDWDDSSAAYKYRIWQAREIINVCVTVLPDAKNEVRAYVSLKQDRKNPSGGYRAMVDIVNDADLYSQYIRQAKEELLRFQEKYAEITELGVVFDAIEEFAEVTQIRPRLVKAG